MSLTDRNVNELRSKESNSLLMSGNLMLIAAISGAAALPQVAHAIPQPYVYSHFSESSFQGTMVTIKSITTKEPQASRKTALGEKLRSLRSQAIAKGMPLLSPDEISLEVQRRRGEID